MQELLVQKSCFFQCDEYMDIKIMSRVLVGFDETSVFRGHTDGRGDGHGFFERLPHKSPFGAKKGIQGGGDNTVTVCSKTPKIFGAFGADFTKNQWFYTSCWASTAGGGKFLSFLHRFMTILHSKTLIFQCKTQNPSTKSSKFSPAAHWS